MRTFVFSKKGVLVVLEGKASNKFVPIKMFETKTKQTFVRCKWFDSIFEWPRCGSLPLFLVKYKTR